MHAFLNFAHLKHDQNTIYVNDKTSNKRSSDKQQYQYQNQPIIVS